MIRKPAVANQFYDGDPMRLRRQLDSFMTSRAPLQKAIAVIAPHAGYMYSGAVAGAAYARVSVPQTVLVLGPSHTGLGRPAAVMTQGAWTTPLGTVAIAEDLGGLVLKHSRYLEDDVQAHVYEHSLEVQVPFLQYRQPDLQMVPICLASLPFEVCQEIGNAIATAVTAFGRPVLLVASTDMTHYESQERAEARDRLAIEHVTSLDPPGLLETVMTHGITMCGVIPTTVLLVAALALGAKKAELVRYATSGDVTGDYRQVVGYASFLVT